MQEEIYNFGNIMNREIKFRNWFKNEMSWAGNKLKCGNTVKYFYFDEKPWNSETEGIIMQYTGLNDSSGKEIYEDDIIHIGGWRYPRQLVKFKDGSYRGTNKYVGEGFIISELLKTNVVSVIGNIYENPELIHDSL